MTDIFHRIKLWQIRLGLELDLALFASSTNVESRPQFAETCIELLHLWDWRTSWNLCLTIFVYCRSFLADPSSPTLNDSSPFLSMWPRREKLSSPSLQQQQQQQPTFESNLNLMNSLNNNSSNSLFDQRGVEPLRILTNEFAENLGLHSKDFDSGYLSPNNTNGYHLPGKPGLNHNIYSSNDSPKYSFGFGDESSSFLPYPGAGLSRSSPETLPYEPNVSPPPMDFRTSGFSRFSSSSSSRASRPNSQDLELLLAPKSNGFQSNNLVGLVDTTSSR